VLLDGESGLPAPAPWAGPLVALGACLVRRRIADSGSYVVVALTVPVRDYAAPLIATGWMLARKFHPSGFPSEVARSLSPGTPVRMVASGDLVAGRFFGLVEVSGRERIHVGASSWHLDSVGYITAAPDLPERRFGRIRLAGAGSMIIKTGRAQTWIAEQCHASSEVVMIGTKSWLAADLQLELGWGDLDKGFDSLSKILRPDDGDRPSWASSIISAQLFESTSVPVEAKVALLDGSSAIRWLSDVATPYTIAVIDRSSPDEFASSSIAQLRSMGRPVPLKSIGWMPPPGVEALAFEAYR
jgi:hypothetical protein